MTNEACYQYRLPPWHPRRHPEIGSYSDESTCFHILTVPPRSCKTPECSLIDRIIGPCKTQYLNDGVTVFCVTAEGYKP